MLKKRNFYSNYMNEEVVEFFIQNVKFNFIKNNSSRLYLGLNVFAGSEDSMFYQNNELVTLPTGIAHFVEHVLFSIGENNVINDLINRGLDINGATSNSGTYYYFGGMKDQILNENMASIFIDIFSWIDLSEKIVSSEKNIILEEGNLEYNTREYLTEEYIGSRIFDNSGNNTPIIGKHDDIASTTPTHLKTFYNSFYKPDNMIFTIYGNLTDEELENLIESINNKFNEIKSERKVNMFNDENEVRKITPSATKSILAPEVVESNSFNQDFDEYYLVINNHDKIDIRDLKLTVSLILSSINDEFNDTYRKYLEENNIKINDIDSWYKNFNNKDMFIVVDIKDTTKSDEIFNKLIEFLKTPISKFDFDFLMRSKKIESLENKDDSIDEKLNDMLTHILFYCSSEYDKQNLENDVNYLQFTYDKFNEIRDILNFDNVIKIMCRQRKE